VQRESVYRSLENHVRHFFAGHEVANCAWATGPTPQTLPGFRVLSVAPGPKSRLWVYVSIGAWEASSDSELEFLICAPDESPSQVELLAMAAYYHQQEGLGVGHTVPIGRPWLPGSALDHLLVSRPYPFGEALEVCDLGEHHVHFLWLLPITLLEKEFALQNGLEALEQRFEKGALRYWRADRGTLV
jgi:suppressor of fused protein SUFU